MRSGLARTPARLCRRSAGGVAVDCSEPVPATRSKQPFSFLVFAQVLTAMFCIAVFVAKVNVVYFSGLVGYQAPEWIVSYAAGFMRRGLSGELLLLAASVTGMNFLVLVKSVAGLTLAAFMLLFVRRVASAPGLSRDERFALLFMPNGLAFVLLNPLVVLRKDYIAFLAFFGFLALIESPGRLRTGRVFAYLALIGSAAILVHEIFFLLFIPYVAVLLYARLREAPVPAGRPAPALRAAALLAIPILTAAMALAAQPAPGAAAKTCEQAREFAPELQCTPIPEALKFIEMRQGRAFELSHFELVRTRLWGLPAGLFWAFLYLLFGWLHYEVLCRMLLAHLGPDRRENARSTAFALLVFNSALLLGMSAVGFDVGRWIFILTSLATLCAASPVCAVSLAALTASLGDRDWTLRAPRLPTNLYVPCILAAAFACWSFRFKHCCVYRVLDWFWLAHDVMEYLRMIPAAGTRVLAGLSSLACSCDCLDSIFPM